MPYAGNGSYSAPANSWNPAVDGTDISTTDWAALLADLSTALSTAITKDGQTTTTASVPFAAGLSSGALVDISGAAAGQIKFPASQNASSNANTLDDYEEGIFTPVLDFGGGTTGITYSVQDGAYTKIGNAVNFWIQLQLTSKGSSIGISHVTGLPFTVARIAALAFYADAVVISGAIQAFAENATTSIRLVGLGTGTVGAMLDTNFTNTSLVLLSGSYRV